MHGGPRILPTVEGDALAADPAPEPSAFAEDQGLCLETLYREESPRLLRSLARRMANREDARDLVGEIFCRLARVGAGGLPVQRPQAYLSRMATNLLRDRAKQASRQMHANHVSTEEVVLASVDQQRLLESRDLLSRVEAAMLKLRPRTREIFMAHRIDGLTYAEIAERTGLSQKGVEKQMSKAIAQIDRLMDRT